MVLDSIFAPCFSLDEILEAAGPEAETAAPPSGEGTIMGTAASLLPEQADGNWRDARSDIFSVGTLACE